jgi:hypothetical protein
MTVSVDTFMEGVLSAEGWMSPLSGDVVASAIARLESALPPGATLSDERAHALRQGLREIAVLASALAAGTLSESQLVEGCLGLLEV